MLDSAVKPCYNLTVSPIWRDVRAVEGARLESVYTGNCIKGSNPFLSVSKNAKKSVFLGVFLLLFFYVF